MHHPISTNLLPSSIQFNTFDHAFAALFSTINGDTLYERFLGMAVHPAYTFIARYIHPSIYIQICHIYSLQIFVLFHYNSRVYEYSFVCIACYAVVNIFIAIIQEAYTQTRKEQIEIKMKDNNINKNSNTNNENNNNQNNNNRISFDSITTEQTDDDPSTLLKTLQQTQQQLVQIQTQMNTAVNKIATIESLLLKQLNSKRESSTWIEAYP